MSHKTSVHFMAAWREYRPECTCGWVGSYWSIPADAGAEAERHRKENR